MLQYVAVCILWVSALPVLATVALPQNGVVVSGETIITTPSAIELTIQQNSDRAAINWQSFDVGESAVVRFAQPSVESVILNRVLSGNPSQILGRIEANGQVFLSNPQGIYFSETATADVGGLVATTHSISDADFMAGQDVFGRAGAVGKVENKGELTAGLEGYVALLAPEVRNEGVIVAKMGVVVLASGEQYELQFNESKQLTGIRVEASTVEGLVENGNAIRAPGGLIILSAKGMSEVQRGIVNNSGIIEANDLVVRNGKILLEADQMVMNTGKVVASSGEIAIKARTLIEQGTIDASGTEQAGSIQLTVAGIEQSASSTISANAESGLAGKIRVKSSGNAYLSGHMDAIGITGGALDISAKDIILAGFEAKVDGRNQGGTIRIGGGLQGKAADIANAESTLVNQGLLSANAIQSGNGGTVIVWSDNHTQFAGTIHAQGGKDGGDGGFVEVSSEETLGFGGKVLVDAPLGKSGSVLFDPKNITVATSVSGLSIIPLTYATPLASDQHGSGSAVELLNGGASTDRVVVASPLDNSAASAAGAVRLYQISDGTLLATLTGSTASDNVGTTGVTALTNGNYVVRSANWDNGAVTNAGAVTWGNGATGVSGVVSAANSLVGSTANDNVGGTDITALSNGHYVVASANWDNPVGSVLNVGAVTWCDGTTGRVGAVSAANSLVGSTANDNVGGTGVTALTNGHYVVRSANWDNGAVTNAGAVTWCDGSTGRVGAVSVANSIVGSTASDAVGTTAPTVLSNNNYVLRTANWNNGGIANAGAVTWCSGTAATVGAISAANSLVGSTTGDAVGTTIATLTGNSNYVVRTNTWNNGGSIASAGAVTWCSGVAATVGAVSSANSLVGSTASDQVGSTGVTALSNGHYVVGSSVWDNGATVDAGAVTWCDGTTGRVGAVSAANSLVGSRTSDQVGSEGVTALTNGHYVVASRLWDNGVGTANAGAVTWCNGTTGRVGALSSANSLVGGTTNDYVGNLGVTALTNGNYVVVSSFWQNGSVIPVGAVTWCNGATGRVGTVTAANSLVGSTSNDQVGNPGVTALSNGNYVVRSIAWDNGAATNAGAVTWGNGTSGVTGVVSSANSIVGSTASDAVGTTAPTILSNGNYVLRTANWNSSRGAVTWCSGTSATVGAISAANSLVGSTASDAVGTNITTLTGNGNYVVSTSTWNNGGSVAGAGAVTWCSGTAATVGAVTVANSLVGSAANDNVGSTGVTALTTGNYIVRSSNWDNGAITNAGAVTWGNGATGTVGTVSTANSLIGNTANDTIGSGGILELSNGRVVVRSPLWDNGATANVGRVDIISSLPGDVFANPYPFATNASSSSTILVGDITTILNAGTALTLQANNDFTLNNNLIANNAGGNGGVLTIQAGRSILLNANITTDNGNLILTANETLAAGVVDGQRDAGAADITMAGGTSINAGTGSVTITLGNGAGKTNLTSGDITLRAITADAINIQNQGTTAGSDVTLSGALTANTGVVYVSAHTGDINLSQNITTNNTSSSAIILNAGKSTAAGTSTGGNVLITGTPTITTGAGGRTTFFTGSVSGSTGLTAFIGSGSNRFRYNSNESTTNYTTALGTGNHGIYREAVAITIAANNDSKTYNGLAYSGGNGVNYGALVNGDVIGTIGGSLSYGGTSQGVINAGSYTIIPTRTNGFGYSFTVTNGTLTVNTAPLTITANAASKTYDGLAYTGGNGVAYSGFVNSETSAVLGGTLAYGGTSQGAINAGAYTITPSGLTSSNYAITFANGTLTVNTVPLTITAANDSKTYNGLAYSGGNGVSYSGFVNSETSAVLGGTLAYGGTSQGAINAGTYTITPSGLTSSNYAITFANGTLTVNTVPLTITAANDSKTYNGLAYSGGNGVSYSGFVNSETSAVLGGSLAYGGSSQGAINVGAYTIVPSGLTSSNYAITFANGTLTVSTAPLTITANADSKTYNGLAYTGGNGVSYSGFVNSETSAVLGGTLAYGGSSQGAINVGAYTIVPSGLTSSNYAIAFANGTLTVSTAPLTITAANDSKTYNGLAYIGGNGVSYSGFVNSETSAVLGGTLAYGGTSQGAINAGPYTIVPSGLTSSNYAIAFANGTLTVSTAPLTITANADSKTYNGLAYSGGNGVSYSGFVNSETAAVLGGALAYGGTSQGAINGGTYNITPSGLTSSNYAITFANGTLTVSTAPLTITAANDSKTYNGLAYIGGNGVSYSGFVNSETSAVLGGTLAYGGTSQGATNVGAYTIVPSGLTSSNYAITFANGTLTVSTAPLTITAANDSTTYNGLAYSGGNGVSYSGFVNSETSAVLGGTLAYGGTSQGAINVGAYTIVPSGLTSSNYAITFANGTLTVNTAPLTITAANDSKTYNGLAYTGGNGVSYSGFVNSETSAVLGGTLAYGGTSQGATNVGAYTIVPSGLTSSNYAITFANGTLTVSTAPLTITAANDSKTYNGLAYTGGNGASYSGFVNSETSAVLGGTLAYGGSSQGAINVGAYTIVPSGLTSSNYAITFANGTLTVNTAPLTITAANDNKIYDGMAYSGGNGVSYSGFVNSETSAVLGGTLSYGGSSQGAINLGSYTITPLGLTSSNYAITFTNGTLVIGNVFLTITAANDSKTYDGLAYTGGNGVSYSGFINGDTAANLGGALSYGGSSQGATNAGSYTIIPAGLTSGSYSIIFVNGTLTIGTAPLTITANAASKTYDGVAYSGGNGVTYSGFVNSETAAVLGGALAYGGTSQGAINAGTYNITPSGLTSSNYAITFADGNLSITPALVLSASANIMLIWPKPSNLFEELAILLQGAPRPLPIEIENTDMRLWQDFIAPASGIIQSEKERQKIL